MGTEEKTEGVDSPPCLEFVEATLAVWMLTCKKQLPNQSNTLLSPYNVPQRYSRKDRFAAFRTQTLPSWRNWVEPHLWWGSGDESESGDESGENPETGFSTIPERLMQIPQDSPPCSGHLPSWRSSPGRLPSTGKRTQEVTVRWQKSWRTTFPVGGWRRCWL